MDAVRGRVEGWRRSGVLGQLIRFGIAGGLSTLIYSAVYLPLATWALPLHWAVLAVPPAFLISVVCGFFLHSYWSFRGHGARQQGAGQKAKFMGVQSFGLVLNSLFTWVITSPLHGPAWAPLIPIVTITPLVTFLIQRNWVFG